LEGAAIKNFNSSFLPWVVLLPFPKFSFLGGFSPNKIFPRPINSSILRKVILFQGLLGIPSLFPAWDSWGLFRERILGPPWVGPPPFGIGVRVVSFPFQFSLKERGLGKRLAILIPSFPFFWAPPRKRKER